MDRTGDRTGLGSSHLVLAVSAAGLLALAPAQAGAQQPETGEPAAEAARKAWDPARMTELSGDLARAVSALRQTFRKEPSFRDPSNPNRRANREMEQTLRLLEQSARQLHNRVKGGAGYEETLGIARKIGSLLNDADVESRKIMTSVWVEEKVKPAMELINEIAPYYGSGPLYDPETRQRLDRPPNPNRAPAAE